MKLALLELLRIPALALAAFLGLSEVVRGHAVEESHHVGCADARVISSDHVRIGETSSIDIELRNSSSEVCDVVVTLSREYASAWDVVTILPEPSARWSVRLDDVAPGEQRLVALELRGADLGAYSGELRIEADRESVLHVPLHTVVSP
jgi:hypothetical protein